MFPSCVLLLFWECEASQHPSLSLLRTLIRGFCARARTVNKAPRLKAYVWSISCRKIINPPWTDSTTIIHSACRKNDFWWKGDFGPSLFFLQMPYVERNVFYFIATYRWLPQACCYGSALWRLQEEIQMFRCYVLNLIVMCQLILTCWTGMVNYCVQQ